MTTNEAKKVIGTILDWGFIKMGITERCNLKESDVDLTKYSLTEILQANKLVQSNNNRKMKLQQYHSGRNKNNKSKGVSLMMSIDDRMIAGVYFALHYPANGELHVVINDIGAGCVKVKKYD